MDVREQKRVIQDGFEELIRSNDFVVVEGTGHTGESRKQAYRCCRAPGFFSPRLSPNPVYSRSVNAVELVDVIC